jgi:hypothetical protein
MNKRDLWRLVDAILSPQLDPEKLLPLGLLDLAVALQISTNTLMLIVDRARKFIFGRANKMVHRSAGP